MSFDCAAGFARWIADLESRHLRELTPTEVARALRALSSTYVERRARLGRRGAFDSAGKRAAYALYYAPRRYLMTAHVLAELAAPRQPGAIVDLGCGTGAGGAAWACHTGGGASIVALDVHPWALDETAATHRAFALDGRTARGSVTDARWSRPGRSRPGPAAPLGVILSYVANELDDEDRRTLLDRLLAAAASGAHVLVMEPISRKTSPWWPAWTRTMTGAGGRHDEWRLRLTPPPITAALGRAAGLDPHEATGRTLWLPPTAPR